MKPEEEKAGQFPQPSSPEAQHSSNLSVLSSPLKPSTLSLQGFQTSPLVHLLPSSESELIRPMFSLYLLVATRFPLKLLWG